MGIVEKDEIIDGKSIKPGLIGIEKQPNEFKIEAIPNSAIGQAPTILEFEAPQESPAVEKYRSAMTVLSIIITAALLIWYFFIK